MQKRTYVKSQYLLNNHQLNRYFYTPLLGRGTYTYFTPNRHKIAIEKEKKIQKIEKRASSQERGRNKTP